MSPANIEHNKAVVRTLVDEFLNKGNPEALARNAHAEYKWIPVSDDKPMDLETHKTDFPDLKTIYGDLKYKIERQVAEGDWVATHGTMSGKHIGEMKTPFGTFAPSGKECSWQTISMHRFRDGKVLEGYVVYNPLDALQQLGFVKQWPEGYGSAKPRKK